MLSLKPSGAALLALTFALTPVPVTAKTAQKAPDQPVDPVAAAAFGFAAPLATFSVAAGFVYASNYVLPKPHLAYAAFVTGGFLAVGAPMSAMSGHWYVGGESTAARALAVACLAVPVGAIAYTTWRSTSEATFESQLAFNYLAAMLVLGTWGGLSAWHAAHQHNAALAPKSVVPLPGLAPPTPALPPLETPATSPLETPATSPLN